MTKVHLGCGRNYIPGWVNIDLFTSVKADTYADLMALPFQPDSIDVLYVGHLLEHSHRHAVVATLSYWRGLLKLGGILRLAVPDFRAAAEWYVKTGCLDDIMGLLHGGQNFHRNYHFVSFDEATLRRDLKRAGFEIIRPWDWRTTEHAQFDDYASATLPCDPVTRKPIDREHGLQVSLNLEAVR